MKSMRSCIFALTEIAGLTQVPVLGARALGQGFPLFGGCGVAAAAIGNQEELF
jgi:hypothetical protein